MFLYMLLCLCICFHDCVYAFMFVFMLLCLCINTVNYRGHTKDVIQMVPVVPLFSTEHSTGKILALSQELR